MGISVNTLKTKSKTLVFSKSFIAWQRERERGTHKKAESHDLDE